MIDLGMTTHYHDRDMGLRITKQYTVSKDKIFEVISKRETHSVRQLKKQVKIAPRVSIRGIRLLSSFFGHDGAELRTLSAAPTSEDKILQHASAA